MSERTYYQRNRDVTLNRGKDYYKDDKERLRDNVKNQYRNLSEEEKERQNMEEIDIIKCLKKRNKN